MNMIAPVRRPPARRVRRRAVLCYTSGLGLVFLTSVLILALAPEEPARSALLGPYLLGVLLTLCGGWQLGRPSLLGLPQAGEDLDERQQARLSQAMSAAYRLLSLLLVFVLVTLLLSGEELLERLRGTQAGVGLAFVFLWLIPFLPSAVLAWTEPDAGDVGEE